MLNNKTILITGGTGSFGNALTNYISKFYPKIKKLIIYSRDELKQYQMKKTFIKSKISKKIRFFIGDIRDKDRLIRAFEDVDIVIHAAALKQVDTAEYNPIEFIKTNILGSSNIIDAALNSNVRKVIALSTDKASSPINLYGATKLCADKLFCAAGSYAGKKDIKFSVVRYGNVMGSRGSVIPLFLKDKEKGIIKITDNNMTRFNISLNESIKLVIKVIENQQGGEIFIPKIRSYKIIDLAKVIAPKSKIKVIGLRPGEKIHEEMISENEQGRIIEFKDLYVIQTKPNENKIKYKNLKNGKVIKSFKYSSDLNKNFLTPSQIRDQIKKNYNTFIL